MNKNDKCTAGSDSRNQDTSKRPNLRLKLFLSGASLFLITQLIGFGVGFTLFSHGYAHPAKTSSSVSSFLISFSIATIVFILLLKFFKGKSLFKFLLAFLIFIGSETVFGTFIPEEIAILLAIEVVIIRFLFPTVLSQNISMIAAIAGIGAILGLFLSVWAVLIILVVLSVYDVVAVFKTKHMVKMFTGLIKKGVPFSLIIPSKSVDLRRKVIEAKPGKGDFLLLGTGDVAFPIILSVSALSFGLLSSIAIILGALVGLFSVHFILVTGKHKAIPALPPIAFFSILFFFVSVLTGGLLYG